MALSLHSPGRAITLLQFLHTALLRLHPSPGRQTTHLQKLFLSRFPSFLQPVIHTITMQATKHRIKGTSNQPTNGPRTTTHLTGRRLLMLTTICPILTCRRGIRRLCLFRPELPVLPAAVLNTPQRKTAGTLVYRLCALRKRRPRGEKSKRRRIWSWLASLRHSLLLRHQELPVLPAAVISTSQRRIAVMLVYWLCALRKLRLLGGNSKRKRIWSWPANLIWNSTPRRRQHLPGGLEVTVMVCLAVGEFILNSNC